MKKNDNSEKAFPEIPVHLHENDVYKLEETAFKARLHTKTDVNIPETAGDDELGRSIELY